MPSARPSAKKDWSSLSLLAEPETRRRSTINGSWPYNRRNRIEIMFGRLKDWRRVANRYDRRPKVFLSAVALAATVIFWL